MIGLRPISKEMVEYLTSETMVEVAKRLKEKNIFLAVRCGAFRIAPYLDSTSKDWIGSLNRLKKSVNHQQAPSVNVNEELSTRIVVSN